MHATTIAVDLAKRVFEVAVANRNWHVVARHRFRRPQFDRFLRTQAPAHVVMEACGTAHFWARCAREHGHQVSLLPAQYVPSVRAPQQDRPHRRRRAARGRRHATPRAPPACPRPALRRRGRDGASDRHPRARARARRFASWLGLTPSERPSGARRRRGSRSRISLGKLRACLACSHSSARVPTARVRPRSKSRFGFRHLNIGRRVTPTLATLPPPSSKL